MYSDEDEAAQQRQSGETKVVARDAFPVHSMVMQPFCEQTKHTSAALVARGDE